MSDHTTSGAAPAGPAGREPWPPLAPPIDPPPVGRAGRVAVVLAGLALLAYAVAAVLLAVPVETPDVQDCGSPGAYLLAGRLDTVPDEEGRIRGPDDEVLTLDEDVAAEARAMPCRERVADRAVPASILLVAATTLGAGAFALELLVVRPAQRRAVRAAMAAPPPAPPGSWA